MERIDKILMNLTKITPDETLRGFLIKSTSMQEAVSTPKDYYNLTDLCNPTKTHLKRKYPELQKAISENEKAKIMGNKIHKMAEIWIQNMPGFYSSESRLDGFNVGIKAIGRIDAKVGENILEFKSKINLPSTVEEVINNYPQDIEQLGFYSVMDPLKPRINYLIFISQEGNQDIRVYRMIIKSPEEILKVLKKRVGKLDGLKGKYIKEEQLTQCRYCNPENCTYKKGDICFWEKNKLPCEILDFIELYEDKDYLKEILQARNKWDKKSEMFAIYELISSRKTLYNNSTEKMDNNWKEELDRTLAKVYASHISFLVRKEYGSEISEYPEPKLKDIRKHNKWLKLKTSKNPKGLILPYVTGASLTKSKYYLNHKPNYKITELGLICAQYGISKGYVIEYLPNLDIKFRAFEISFGNTDPLIKEANKIISALKHNKIKNFENLPLCPDFFCDDCHIKEFCDNNNVEE